jgi:serine/threonine-protein kinase
LGDVVFIDNDVVGDGVNIAIRVQEEAAPRGICISQTIYDAVQPSLSLKATHLGSLEFKPVEGAIQVYQILPVSELLEAAAGTDTIREAQLSLGTVINNRYRIEEVLGHGGFGRTYLASDTHCFGDYCVLKEFVPASRADYVVQKSRQLFEREARVLYEINHPQIPRFLAWLTDQGRLFLVQEYIDGKTYAALVQERSHEKEQPFSEAEVIQWLRDLLPVLGYLHQRNLVHRDISPENIMLSNSQSKPVLIDFGLVKQTISQILETHANSSVYTSQASVVGKFGYSPPEQIQMGQCYPCSDLYALGVTAIVLLTGQDLEVLIDHQSLEWKWHSYANISDHLKRILDKLLAEKPRERYQSAEEVLADLSIFGADGAIVEQNLPAIQIEIDENKRRRQVAEIVETDYFQELMQEAEGFRDDFFEIEGLQSRVEPNDLIESDETVFFDSNAIEQPTQLNLATAASNTEILSTPSIEPKTEVANPTPTEVRTKVIAAPPTNSQKASVNSQPEETVALDPAFLETCQQELTRFIGPMAGLIIKNVLSQQPQITRLQLVEALAARIPDPKQLREFKDCIRQQPLPETEPRAMSKSVSNQPISNNSLRGQPSIAPSTPPQATLTAEFLSACQQELARCIGPIASIVIQTVTAREPNATAKQLVETLVSQIPDPKEAEEFIRRLSRFTG